MTTNTSEDHITLNSAEHLERIIAEKNKEINLLEKKIESYGKTMVDGAIDNEEYLKSKYRIAWFLKESYADENEENPQYYRSLFTANNLYEDFFKNVAVKSSIGNAFSIK